MNNVSLFKTGSLLLYKTAPKGIKAENIRYAAKEAGKCKGLDEFVHTQKVSEGMETAKKGVTKQLQEIFHAYTQFKRIEFPISKVELDELLKFDGDELVDKAVNLFMEKMKIPLGLKPAIMSYPQNKETGMTYDFIRNFLMLNPNAEIISKQEYIGFIAHELRHMAQNFDVLRTEGLGDKAVKSYAKKWSKIIVNNIEKLIKKGSVEEYKKTITSEPTAVADFERLVKLRRANPKEYEKCIVSQQKTLEDALAQKIQEFRKIVVSEMGELKSDSEQGQRAKKYLQGFMTNYIKKDGTIDAGKYNFIVSEREALNLGWSVESKAKSADDKFCFMRFLKTYNPRRSDDEARNKEIEKEIQELEERIRKMGIKEYLRYIYG